MADGDPLDLVAKHLQSLYLTGPDNRLCGINQWDGGTVPRFHLARCRDGNLVRFHVDLPAPLCAAVAALCERELASLSAAPVHAARYVELLAADAPIGQIRQGPVFAFPTRQSAPRSAVDIVSIDSDNAHLLAAHLPDWLPDVAYRTPFFAACHEGTAVAVCASVRITDDCHQAGVETAAGFRRQGFAAAVTRAWAQRVRALGAEPIYSTTWDNAASQQVASSLGLSLIGVDFQVI